MKTKTHNIKGLNMIQITNANAEFNYFLTAGKIKPPKNDKREFVQYLYVKDNMAYRTDTKILIRFETELSDGFYQFNRVTKSIIDLVKIDTDIEYPDADSILLTDDKYPALINFYEHTEFQIIEFNDLFGAIIQKQYIDIATIASDEFTAYGSDNKTPVILISPCCTVALMSMHA
jgi:hypothetical protein